jgi:hypothetical protein
LTGQFLDGTIKKMKNVILGVVGVVLIAIIAILGFLLWQSGQETNQQFESNKLDNKRVADINKNTKKNSLDGTTRDSLNNDKKVNTEIEIGDNNDNNNFKKFTDKDSGLSFEYPKSLVQRSVVLSNSAKILKQIILEQPNGDNSTQYIVNIYKSTFSPVDAFRNWHRNNIVGGELISIEKTKIGNNNALQTVEIDGIDSQGAYIYFLNNKHAVSFRCDNNNINKKYLFENILATIKFIK